MAPPVNSSPSVHSGPHRNQNYVSEIMMNIEVLLEENKVLDKKVNSLMKKQTENSEKISGLVGKVKRMGMGGDYVEAMDGQEDGDEYVDAMNGQEDCNEYVDSINGQEDAEPMDGQEDEDERQDEENVVNLKEKENLLLQSMEESTRNLRDHEELLQDLKAKGGQDQNWRKQYENVSQYRDMHKKYKDSAEKKLNAIRRKWIETGSQSGAETSRSSSGRKEVSRISEPGPSSTKSSFTSKSILNESVVDCGFKKKISPIDKEAMVRVLKMEEDSPPNPYKCDSCPQSFTSAAPLVIHLEKHSAEAQEKIRCPFSSCSFSANKDNLTKHVRAKHTKEQLFSCSFCQTKFHTRVAKMSHEKRHSQPDMWAQCGKAACLRFYQVAKGNCRCGKK